MPSNCECHSCDDGLTHTVVDLGTVSTLRALRPRLRLDEAETLYPSHVRLCSLARRSSSLHISQARTSFRFLPTSPDQIIAPSCNDAHQDHKTMGKIVATVFGDAPYLPYEVPKWKGDFGLPSVYVPMPEKVVRHKVELLHKSFPSQRAREQWDNEVFLALARSWGMDCRASLAEAFTRTKSIIMSIRSVPDTGAWKPGSEH